MTTHDRPTHGGYPGEVRTATPPPNNAFWMPDESGEGGEWMTPGQVFYSEGGGWMVQIDKFRARPASAIEAVAFRGWA